MAGRVTRRWLYLGSVGLVQAAAVALILILWQKLSEHHMIDPVFFSGPTRIWDQIKSWESSGLLWSNIGATMKVFAVGYVVGTAVGTLVGVVLGTIPLVREVLEPFLAFFNAMPRLVLLPLMIVWFGFGLFPKVLLVVAVIQFVVAINVATGLTTVRSDLLDNARLMGASHTQLILHVYAPSIALWILTTARTNVGYAFNAAIAAEFIGASAGLGYLLTLGQTALSADQVWAALVLASLMAVLIDCLLAAVERRSLRWMPGNA
jgi:NitT/TauT family transport system permease protein